VLAPACSIYIVAVILGGARRSGGRRHALVLVATAEATMGREINGGGGAASYAAMVTVNSAASWYTGTDGAPSPGRRDLVSVLVHEVYRGLTSAGAAVERWGWRRRRRRRPI
jgi:hypothetical protein